MLWLDIFDDAVAACEDEPLAIRLTRAAEEISQAIDADPEPVRRALEVAQGSPNLAVGFGNVNRRWIDRVDVEVAKDHPADAFRSRVIAAAFMGAIDAALTAWSEAGGRSAVADLVDQGISLVTPLLDPEPNPEGT